MRNFSLLSFLVLFSLILFPIGCDSDDGASNIPSVEEDLQGTWVLVKHEINVEGTITFLAPPAALVPITLVLNEDNTYSWTRGTVTTTGEWSAADGMITLNNNDDSEYFFVLWESEVILTTTITENGIYTITEFTFERQ